MTDVSDLVRRLERLAKKKKEISLGRKITAKSVIAFEKKHRITLPDEYRAFVLGAGEGASGPDYGLLALDHAVSERGTTIYDLADPFQAPLSNIDHLDFGSGGILPVCYSGCSYFSAIVITGPERGEMWFSIEDRPGWVPHGRSGTLGPKGKKDRAGFAAWYSDWLAGEEKALGWGAS